MTHPPTIDSLLSRTEAVEPAIDLLTVARDSTACHFNAVPAFRNLWNSLHKPPHAWADNPDVVCIQFVCHQINVDRLCSPNKGEARP